MSFQLEMATDWKKRSTLQSANYNYVDLHIFDVQGDQKIDSVFNFFV